MKEDIRSKHNKFYITTAIDYANASPHLGHAYEKICADTIARWHRFKGEDVYFLTGTDENAQKNVQAAKVAGINVKEFITENSKKFINLCHKLNLSNDDFIRTTEKRHVEVSQLIFKKLYDKGDIYKGFYEGYYCDGCEAFITERELIDGRCPEHNIEPRVIKEENYLFRLSKYQKDILKLLEHDLVEPESRKNEIINRVKAGLNDLSVSRKSLDWGIPVPFDKEHRIYVWIDALINYISALGYPDGEKFKKYWPADIHLIGKGINWFHSCIWPAILMSSEIELPAKIFVHGYVNIQGQKISKSRSNAIDPVQLIDEYGVDALRYFLLREIPFGEDGNFSHSAFIQRYNSDLANDLGNLLNRTLTMIEKYFDGLIPWSSKSSSLDKKLVESTKNLHKRLDNLMNKLDMNRSLEVIWELINKANKYIEDSKPWQLNKNNEERLKTVMYNLTEVLRVVSLSLSSFIPAASNNILKQLNQKVIPETLSFEEIKIWGKIKPQTKILKGKPLFPRIKQQNE